MPSPLEAEVARLRDEVAYLRRALDAALARPIAAPQPIVIPSAPYSPQPPWINPPIAPFVITVGDPPNSCGGGGVSFATDPIRGGGAGSYSLS